MYQFDDVIMPLEDGAVMLLQRFSISHMKDEYLEHFLWNCPLVQQIRTDDQAIVGSGNGSVPSGNKPLPWSMLTHTHVSIWLHHKASVSYHNGTTINTISSGLEHRVVNELYNIKCCVRYSGLPGRLHSIMEVAFWSMSSLILFPQYMCSMTSAGFLSTKQQIVLQLDHAKTRNYEAWVESCLIVWHLAATSAAVR